MEKVETYIKKYTRRCSNELINPQHRQPFYHEWLTPENAMAVAQIAKEETIEKVCEWLEKNMPYGVVSQERVWDTVQQLKKELI